MHIYLAYELPLISRFAWSLVTGQGSYQIHQQGNETRIYNISSDAQHQGTQSKKEVIVWCWDQLDNYHRYNVHYVFLIIY